MDKEQLAAAIVDNVGGKDNVANLYHCVTRLRFTLDDESKANDAVIKDLDGVISVVKSGGQYQVVIGNQVTAVYDAIMAKYHLPGSESEESDTATGHSPAKKGNLFNRLIGVIVGVVGPLISAIAVAGILKGLIALVLSLKLVSATSSTYLFLSAIADAMFYFLPVLVGFSAANKFKANPFIGAGLGMALCYPTLVAAYTAHKTISLFGLPVVLANYTSSLFPVIFAVWLMAVIEHYLVKHTPVAIRSIVVPLLSFIGAIIPTFLIAGPLLTELSSLLSKGIMGIYNIAPVVAGVILGAFWQVIVVFGLHYAFIPVLMNNITTLHYDPINAILTITVFAQMAGALGVWLKTKNEKTKTVAGAATVSAFLGVTEPAIYGISLKFKRVFAMTFIGGACGGAIMTLMNAKMYSFGANAIFAAPLFINPKGIDNSFWAYCIASVVTVVVTTVLTYFFGFKDAKEPEKAVVPPAGQLLGDYTIDSPISGKIVPLNAVKDEVFSSGAMGSGFAVTPADDHVYAPFDGTVEMVFKTKHAIGLLAANGVELLIHMGIDTVNLNGAPFDVHVQKGDTVEKGQLLAIVDWQQIKDKGYDPTTVVCVTNTNEYAQVNAPDTGGNAITNGQQIMSIS